MSRTYKDRSVGRMCFRGPVVLIQLLGTFTGRRGTEDFPRAEPESHFLNSAKRALLYHFLQFSLESGRLIGS